MTTNLLYEKEVDPQNDDSALCQVLGFSGSDTPEDWSTFLGILNNERGEELASRALKVRSEKPRDRNLVGHAMATSRESRVVLVSNDDSMLNLARDFQDRLVQIGDLEAENLIPLESISFSKRLYDCGAYTREEIEASLVVELEYTISRREKLKMKKYKRKVDGLNRIAQALNLRLGISEETDEVPVQEDDYWEAFRRMDGS